MDLSDKKTTYPTVAILMLVLLITALLHRTNGPKQVLKWNFKGPVEKVWYDAKGYPTVIVHGKEYDLFYAIWHFETKNPQGGYYY